MLYYKVTNNETGEVRTWEGEELEKTQRTLRSVLRNDLLNYPNSASKIDIEVTGDNSTRASDLAYSYLRKLAKGSSSK